MNDPESPSNSSDEENDNKNFEQVCHYIVQQAQMADVAGRHFQDLEQDGIEG